MSSRAPFGIVQIIIIIIGHDKTLPYLENDKSLNHQTFVCLQTTYEATFDCLRYFTSHDYAVILKFIDKLKKSSTKENSSTLRGKLFTYSSMYSSKFGVQVRPKLTYVFGSKVGQFLKLPKIIKQMHYLLPPNTNMQELNLYTVLSC